MPHDQKLLTRASVSRRPETLDETNRSVDFIAATEIPARVFDWDRGEPVDEILLMDGLSLPGNRQVPFLDSHDRMSVDSVLGSMREFRIENGQLVGRAFFSKRQKAYDAYRDVADGHITDVSVGYQVEEARWIPEGERQVISGREYVGPLKVSTRWSLKEVSLTPIGADAGAKVRSEPAPTTTAQIPDAKAQEEITQEVIPMADTTTVPVTTPAPSVDTEAVKREAIAQEQKRAQEIAETCRTAGVPEMAADLIVRGVSVQEAQRHIITELAKGSKATPVVSIEMGQADGEKFTRAATDAIMLRFVQGHGIKTPADGAEQMRAVSFSSLARECLRRAGVKTGFLDDETTIRMAMDLGRRSSSAIPNNNNSSLPYILANVATKSLMAGWTIAPQTYRLWCSIGSLPDFKAAKRVQPSDAPDLLETTEGSEVQHGVMSDTGENIQLVTYARKLVITRQAMINDDMSVFDSIFRMFGYRAGNLVNSLPYAVLLANAALTDTGTLFNTTAVTSAGGHANQAGSGAAISGTTLSAGFAAMFAQVAPNGSKLGIRPAFLLTGGAYAFAAQIETGAVLPTATYPSGVINPANIMQPIADANITGNKWFLACRPEINPTVEVAFLNGQQAPTLTEEPTSPILGMDFQAYIDAVAKALDFRGLYYNAGG